MKKQYLVALPCFKELKGFNHRTILVEAVSKSDAFNLVKFLKPNDNIGDIKEMELK